MDEEDVTKIRAMECQSASIALVKSSAKVGLSTTDLEPRNVLIGSTGPAVPKRGEDELPVGGGPRTARLLYDGVTRTVRPSSPTAQMQQGCAHLKHALEPIVASAFHGCKQRKTAD